jgi:hypothetical protein
MSEARVFSPRLIAGIVFAGMVAFAAFVLLLAFGGSIASGGDGRPHPLSNSAVGFSGLVRLLDARGETRFIRRPSELRTEDLVVVALEERTEPRAVADLLRSRGGRATVLILPKWGTVPDPARPGWVRATDAGVPPPRLPGERIRTAVERRSRGGQPSQGQGFLRGISPPVPALAQTAAAKGLQPLLTTSDGGILVGRWGNSPHYLVADPDLLNNHGIADPRRGFAAVRLIEELNSTGAQSIAFDLTLNGFGAGEGRSLLRLAFEPPFLVMTLALVAAAFLAGFHGLGRFGPTKREERAIAFGKAALVENSAGLIRQARRETRLGAAYVDVVRQEAARLTAAPRNLGGEALDEYLDRFSAPGAPNFGELAARLRVARDRDGLISAARALAIWKEELIR